MGTFACEASYAFVERSFNLVKPYRGWELAWLIYSVVVVQTLVLLISGVDYPVSMLPSRVNDSPTLTSHLSLGRDQSIRLRPS